METPTTTRNGHANGNAYRPGQRINLGATSSAPVKPKAPPTFNIRGIKFKLFSPRVFYWWPIVALCLFTFVISVKAAGMAAQMLQLGTILTLIIRVGVTGAEGIVLAWAFCPQLGLVNKRQIKAMQWGIGIIITLQVFEVGLVYSATMYPEDHSLFVAMGVVAALIVITGAVTAKVVVTDEEQRVTQIEAADVRIETSKNEARLAKMRSRQHLDNQRSIIDVENVVRNQEKARVLAAIQTPENQRMIQHIGQSRAQAVIVAYNQIVRAYAEKELGLEATNDGGGYKVVTKGGGDKKSLT